MLSRLSRLSTMSSVIGSYTSSVNKDNQNNQYAHPIQKAANDLDCFGLDISPQPLNFPRHRSDSHGDPFFGVIGEKEKELHLEELLDLDSWKNQQLPKDSLPTLRDLSSESLSGASEKWLDNLTIDPHLFHQDPVELSSPAEVVDKASSLVDWSAWDKYLSSSDLSADLTGSISPSTSESFDHFLSSNVNSTATQHFHGDIGKEIKMEEQDEKTNVADQTSFECFDHWFPTNVSPGKQHFHDETLSLVPSSNGIKLEATDSKHIVADQNTWMYTYNSRVPRSGPLIASRPWSRCGSVESSYRASPFRSRSLAIRSSAYGKEDVNEVKPSFKKRGIKMKPPSDEMTDKRRALNREAAMRYREKKRLEQIEFERERLLLERRNEELHLREAELLDDIARWKSKLAHLH